MEGKANTAVVLRPASSHSPVKPLASQQARRCPGSAASAAWKCRRAFTLSPRPLSVERQAGQHLGRLAALPQLLQGAGLVVA